MADASFHLDRNAVQVQSWIALLEGDALKRCRRDRGSDRAYHAVPRMLIVLRAMLAVEPEKRPAAKRVKKSFASAIREVSSKGGEGMTLHCSEADKEERRRRRKVEAEMAAQKERKMKEETEMKENRAKEAEDAAKEDTFLDSSSVSEFDFGFTDAGSDSETNEDREDLEDVVDRSILEEEDVPVRVNRVSPKLSLPNLDVNIRGIEGLTFRSG